MEVVSVTKFIKLHPEYRQYFDNVEWTTHIVGNAYDYDSTVYNCHLFPYYGLFMGLFIRKCLCTRFGMDCIDSKTIDILQQSKKPGLRHKLACAYARYSDDTTKAINIVNDIKVVAVSHRIYYHGEQLNNILQMKVNYANLKEIIQFVNSLPYGSMMYKALCDFEFDLITLSGCVDFIFDDNVFCQIATSKYEGSYKNKITQLVFYALSHYEQNYYADDEEHTYELMIYNPLLNEMHTTYIEMNPWVYEDMHGEIERDMSNLLDHICYHKYVKNM